MKQYLSLGAGIIALVTEALIFLSLMELPPFGKGGSDIIWGFPFFCLGIMGVAIPGLLAAISAKKDPQNSGKVVAGGLITNGLSLAIPVLLIVFALIRALLSR